MTAMTTQTITQMTRKMKMTNKPISYGWISLGAGKGIKWILWDTNITLQRQEKQGDKWLTTEELHLAPKVLKEINWRVPSWLQSMEGDKSGKTDD